MTSVAYLPIVADRYGPLVRHLYVAGLDLTGVMMRAQVRLTGDTPGQPLVDLLTVTNGNAQGLRLVEVTKDAQGLPTSHVEIVINETTMEGLPYAGALGDAVQFAWDMQITLAGRKRRLAKGEFEITGDGVTGADAAPVNRPIGYGRPVQPITSPWKAARLTFGEEQVTVSIVDADLVAPLAKKADEARIQAEAAKADAAGSASAAQLAESGAVAAVGTLYATKEAGLAAASENEFFTVVGDGANTYAILYRKVGGSAVEQARYASKAAYEGPDGAALLGYRGRTVQQKLDDTISVRDGRFAGGAKGDAITDDTAALAAAFAFALQTGARIYVPRGIYQTDPITLDVPSGLPLHIVGDGKDISVLRKRANSEDPALTITTDEVDNYTVLQDIRIDNGFRDTVGVGIRFVNTGRMSLDRVNVRGFGLGIDNVGGLIWLANDVTLLGNAAGFRSRKSDTNVYSNLIKFNCGEIRGSRLAVDIDQANGVVFDTVDFESNGVAGDWTSGVVKLGSNMAQEVGDAVTTFNNCWFEGNKGTALFGSAANMELAVNGCVFLANERSVDVSGLASVMLMGVHAPEQNKMFRIQAARSVIVGGFIASIDDTSTRRAYDTATATADFTGARTNFRLSHSVANPTANDCLIARDSDLLPGGDSDASSIYKYGTKPFSIRFAGGPMISAADGRLGFGGKTPIAVPFLHPAAPASDIVSHLKALGLAG